ncbi:MAG TPA: hypothetical protein PKW75_08195 [candidate division Zixibacteria bacterium]|nr:hypothetical protein [candidate division Zixibacteria bacterium]MDD4917234.1 hypothetical protein [candidate division Zixibacteria bacterium]MDM7971700.1 hypothetical protein [candidate division Zixibacteria bacterium]HOD65896.1 hypothetical protein [candidate division Zixibacteria bacterium]HOZ08252.1 hypothetical protein [candidate division Zixibacteria bacterium]
MPRYLIEVPHEEDTVACARVVKVFLETGSHFLTHADWGCEDGEHKAWITVETDTREAARSVVPPAFRSQAKVTQLTYFTMEEIDAILERHGRGARDGSGN